MDSTTTDVHNDLAWAKGLKRSGLYFDGFVDDVECVLEKHRKDTVTFYGTTGGLLRERMLLLALIYHGQVPLLSMLQLNPSH